MTLFALRKVTLRVIFFAIVGRDLISFNQR